MLLLTLKYSRVLFSSSSDNADRLLDFELRADASIAPTSTAPAFGDAVAPSSWCPCAIATSIFKLPLDSLRDVVDCVVVCRGLSACGRVAGLVELRELRCRGDVTVVDNIDCRACACVAVVGFGDTALCCDVRRSRGLLPRNVFDQSNSVYLPSSGEMECDSLDTAGVVPGFTGTSVGTGRNVAARGTFTQRNACQHHAQPQAAHVDDQITDCSSDHGLDHGYHRSAWHT